MNGHRGISSMARDAVRAFPPTTASPTFYDPASVAALVEQNKPQLAIIPSPPLGMHGLPLPTFLRMVSRSENGPRCLVCEDVRQFHLLLLHDTFVVP